MARWIKPVSRATLALASVLTVQPSFAAEGAANRAISFDKEIAYEDLTAAQKTAARKEARERRYAGLKFCADPGNMPLSNMAGEGLQNRIAEAVGKAMGARVSYFWRPYLERGLTRETFQNKECDILIELPFGYAGVLTSIPIYRSTYVFAVRSDSGIAIDGFDDPDLREKRVGVFQHSGMREALARHGIKQGLDLKIISQDADLQPQKQPWTQVRKVTEGALDIAAVWGPFAGYAVSQGDPLTLIPANMMEDEIVLEFDLAFGVRDNDVVLKYALDFALVEAQDEIAAILDAFKVPLVACSQCAVDGPLPSHGTFFARYREDAAQKRFTEVTPEAFSTIDPTRASPDQVMTTAKVEASLAKGADLRTEMANAMTASDETRVAFLLERGADIDGRDLQGSPPLVTAARTRDTRMLAFLLDRGAKVADTDLAGWNALHHAVLRNHVPSIRLLVARGADASARTPTGLTPLALAVTEGMRWAATALVEAGAPVDGRFSETSLTPLMGLATQGEAFNRDLRVVGGPSVLEVAEALVRSGADVNARSLHGVTPLMIAAGHNNAAMIAFLVKSGADTAIRDEKGLAAIDIAEKARADDAQKALRLFTMTIRKTEAATPGRAGTAGETAR